MSIMRRFSTRRVMGLCLSYYSYGRLSSHGPVCGPEHGQDTKDGSDGRIAFDQMILQPNHHQF